MENKITTPTQASQEDLSSMHKNKTLPLGRTCPRGSDQII